jgi:hypothetical protein
MTKFHDLQSSGKAWRVTWIFLVTIFVINAINGPRTEDVVAVDVAAGPTPEEILQTKIDKQFSFWDGSHDATERRVKERLVDPKSYEHIKTTYNVKDDHLLIKLRYRSRNGFGGMVTGTAFARVTFDEEIFEFEMH